MLGVEKHASKFACSFEVLTRFYESDLIDTLLEPFFLTGIQTDMQTSKHIKPKMKILNKVVIPKIRS